MQWHSRGFPRQRIDWSQQQPRKTFFSKVGFIHGFIFKRKTNVIITKLNQIILNLLVWTSRMGQLSWEATKLVPNQQLPNQEIPTCSFWRSSSSKAASVSAEVIFHLLKSFTVSKEAKRSSLGSRLSGYPSGYVCGKTVGIATNTCCRACVLCKINMEKP